MDYNGLVILRDYGKVTLTLKQVLDQANMTRNQLSKLTGVRYEVVNRYYQADSVERVDLDFLAKVCCVLRCDISDLLEYQPGNPSNIAN